MIYFAGALGLTALTHRLLRARSRRFIAIMGALFVSMWLALLLFAENTGNFAVAYLGGLAGLIGVSLLVRAALRRPATPTRS